MFGHVQKSVVYADFVPPADPLRANVRNGYLFSRQDARYQRDPSVFNLLKLIWRAMTVR